MPRINIKCVALTGLLLLNSAADAQSSAARDLAEVRTTAKELCTRPELYGYTKSQSGKISGSLDVGLVAKKLVSGGVDANVDLNNKEWKGVVQDEAATALADFNKCTQNITKMILDYFVTVNTSSASKTPGPTTYYPNWQRNDIYWPTNSATENMFRSREQRVLEQCARCLKPNDHVVKDQFLPMNAVGSYVELDGSACKVGVRISMRAAVFGGGEQQAPPKVEMLFDTVDVTPGNIVRIRVDKTANFAMTPVECLGG